MNYFRCGGGRSTHTATKIEVAKTPLATFQSNVSGLYIPEILAYIQATQAGSGDPSPSNPRAISGVSSLYVSNGGQNLFDKNSPNIIDNYRLSSTGSETSTTGWLISDYIPVNENCFYKAIGLRASSGATTYCCAYNASKEFTRSYIVRANQDTDIVTETGDAYVRLSVRTLSGEQNTAQFIGGISATINLGGTYYKGYLNLQTGLMTIVWGYVDLSGLSYTTTSWGAYRATVSGIKNRSSSVVLDGMASNYVITTYSNLNTNKPNNHLAVGSANSYIYIISDSAPSGYLAYELAEDQTIQLTPAQIEQLLGQNNVFCSSGDVAVKYWKID